MARPSFPINPPSPSAATALWQGMNRGKGLARQAPPTARGWVPRAAAICP